MTPYEKGFEDCKRQVKVAMVAAVENAILMEREACAKLCEDLSTKWYDEGGSARDCVHAIRARWQK
jgi:hypothetical protein